jgi:DNA-binding protein Fis
MTTKRNLVQLDGELIEVKQDSKGKLTAQRLEAEDYVEVHCLEDSVEQMLNNNFNKIANDVLKEVQTGFRDKLRENVLRILGFSNSWDRWEVDHCNDRHSVLTELISNRVKQDFKDCAETLLKKDIEKALVPLRKELVKEYHDEFRRVVKQDMRRQAQEAAQQFLTELLTKQVAKVQKDAIKQAEACFLTRQNQVVDLDD